MNAEQNKKSLKMTNVTQFQKLMCLMEQFPHLATGTPTFGGSRAAMEHTWETVAEKLNAHGPPERNGGEWKKVWQDQKCRLKKKIAGNNKSLHGTGGGPCVINNLTALELDVDRICHLSSAAAPSGQVFGVQKHQQKMMFSHSSNIVVLDNTPPRSSANVAVVTPTRSGTVKQIENVSLSASHHEMSEVFTPNESPIPPLQRPQGVSFSSTPSGSQQSKKKSKNPFQRKRKMDDNSSEKHEQLKLLKKQLEVQENSVVAMNAQAEASRECAHALKAQIEVSKAILDTLKTQAAHNEAQAETSRASLEALKSQAESTGIIAQALVDIVKHLKDEDL